VGGVKAAVTNAAIVFHSEQGSVDIESLYRPGGKAVPSNQSEFLERMLQMASPNVVVVSHSLETQQVLASALGQCGLAAIVASTPCEAEAIINRHPVSLIFCSDELPGDGMDGLIRQTSRPQNKVPVVVVSRLDDWHRYLNFLQVGAFDYVLYPPSGVEIERIVKSALNLGTLAMVHGAA